MGFYFLLLINCLLYGPIIGKGGIEDLTKLSSTIKKIPFKYRGLVHMNNEKPVTLDVIVVYDNSLFSILNNLTAKQYYETRNQLYRDNKHLMSICTWDVLPGKVSPTYNLHVGLNPVCIIIFASYENESCNHKLIIPAGTKEIMVLLNEKTLITPNNGIDYINTGRNKEFAVLETIKKSTPHFETEIPNGYNVFYTLDDMAQPPAIVDNNNLFKPVNIKKANQPLRLETLTTLGDDLDVEDKPFLISKHSSWGKLLMDKLGKFLFNHQGVIDNNILMAHGFVIVHNSYNNPKSFQLIIGLFKNKKIFYLNSLKKFYHSVHYGRQSPLEEKIIMNPQGINGENMDGKGMLVVNGNSKIDSSKNNNGSNKTGDKNMNNSSTENNQNGNNDDKDDTKDPNQNDETQNKEEDKNEETNDNNDGTNNENKDKNDEKNKYNNDLNGRNPNLNNNNSQEAKNNNPENPDEESTKNIKKTNNLENKSPSNTPISTNPTKPSMGNLGSMAGNLNPKFRWANLLNAISNGLSKGKQVLNYVV